MARPFKSDVEYLVDEHGCWVWQRSMSQGYGRCADGTGAHRVFWERSRGPIPQDLEIDHLCRNRACVNPDHMELVTHRENMQRSLRTKVTAAVYTEMREKYLAGATQTEIAQAFGLCRSTVARVFAERMGKGRLALTLRRKARGERNCNSKLTEQSVRDIKRRRVAGEGCTDLAKEYGITKAMVSHIMYGRAWKHVV